MQHDNGKRERGQILALFAISATVIILLVGLVIDGGNALSQRRVSQNTSDFAALAGARIVAQWIGNDATNGTDANVKAAINTTVAANGGDPIVFGAPNGPTYVDANGAVTGYVGAGAARRAAAREHRRGAGVLVEVVQHVLSGHRRLEPDDRLLDGDGSRRIRNRRTSRTCVSRGNRAARSSMNYPVCTGAVGSGQACQPVHLTPGNTNVPGGFGWLNVRLDRQVR